MAVAAGLSSAVALPGANATAMRTRSRPIHAEARGEQGRDAPVRYGIPFWGYRMRMPARPAAVRSLDERVLETGPTTAAELLAQSRALLHRLSPSQACRAMRAGALLLDIRSELQRERDGVVPGSRFVPRNAFEWRCDPSCQSRDRVITAAPDRQLIVMCDEGYQSSLAAATLRRFGFAQATDLVGGFRAWRADGLEIEWRGCGRLRLR